MFKELQSLFYSLWNSYYFVIRFLFTYIISLSAQNGPGDSFGIHLTKSTDGYLKYTVY